MGDANVRRPVATRFEHGVDFGLLVHKSPFMADDRDPLVLSNYIFELLEVNPGVAGFLIQLHPDDVDAVVESVTAHAEKGAGTKTTLYVGQEEEEVEEVEEEEEDAGGVGAGGRKEKPHNPLMISVQKVRIRPGKGKGQSDGWFPQPLTHNTRRVCTDDPENKLPMHSLCPTREWEREWYGVTTPNIVSGQGVILFPFGATPPLIGEAEEVVAAEPLGAFNRDPNDLVLTVGGKLVVNHLLEHDFLSAVQLQSLLDDLDRVPLSEKAPIFNENPPIVGRPQDSGTRRTLYGNYGGANHHRHNPHKLHDLPVLKRVADRVLETAKKTVVGGVGWSCTILDMAEISSYDHTPQHLHRDAPPYTIPEGTLIVNCLIMLTHNHEEEDGSHFLLVPSSSSGFPDPWVERAVPFKRGTAFFFNALDVHRGSGIPKASPTGVSHPRLMAFFAIELTVGGNLRFPNLHVTQSIKSPQLGAPGGRVARTVQCDGAVRCRGKVVANCYGCNRLILCTAHKDGLCVPCQEGEEVEGGEEEEVVVDPNGVSIEQSAQCLLPVGTTTGHFLLSGWGVGREVIAPLTNEEAGAVAGHPDQCPLAKVCHGEALPWPTLQGHVGMKVPAGTILVVRRGLYGGVARVAPEAEGVAQVVEWRQVGEYAAVTDFVWLRRLGLVLDDAKKEGQGMCPCHQV